MSRLALYRKYRSQTFGDLVGQDHVVRTLQNSLEKGRFAHAYLFTGPRGTGKTSSARLLAKALNCERGVNAEPCDECAICNAITQGSCFDVIEIDAASESGVDDVRDRIVAATEYQPAEARYKVFIIDEVHDLSPKAFDALLKTIEEPPPHIVFILATTEFNKVPPTIRSRCQTFEFHRGTISELVKRLTFVAKSEGIEIEAPAVGAIAKMADGGYRDALTLLEQASITADGKISLQHVYDQLGMIDDDTADKVLTAIATSDQGQLLTKLSEIYRSGRDPRSLLESLLQRISELTRAFYKVEIDAEVDAALEASVHATAAQIGVDRLHFLRSGIASAHRSIREVSLPRIWLEAELLRLSLGPAATVQTVRANAPLPNGSAPKEAARAAIDDPVLADAARKWQDVLLELSQYPAFATKMQDSRVAELKKNTLKIDLGRQVFRDWIAEKTQRQKLVTEAARKHFQVADLRLEFVVHRAAATTLPTETAVELPAEGERLKQIAREELSGL